MKRYIKRITAVCMALVLCLCLCSCTFLDELREAHAFYNNAEKTEILYKEASYKLLPIDGDEFTFSGFEEFPDETDNVTEKDVPVLLSGILGDSLTANEDKTLLMVDVNDEQGYYQETVYFARTDIYDDVLQAITDDALNHSCVVVEWYGEKEEYFDDNVTEDGFIEDDYWEEDEDYYYDYDYDYEYHSEYVLLDKAVSDTLDYLVISQEAVSEKDANIQAGSLITVYACDENMWVTKEKYTIFCDYRSYIRVESGSEEQFFLVPDEYKEILDLLYDIVINGNIPNET